MTTHMLLPCLPNEIHDEIFKYLSISECWILAGVCKAWRFTILNWQPLWNCLSTLPNRSIVPDILPYTSFIKSGSVKYIRVLHGDEKHLTKVIKFIQEQAFYAISKVDVYGQELTNEQLSTLINTCGTALTDICISRTAARPNDNIALDTLLRDCLNLTKLGCKEWIFRVGQRQSPWMHGMATNLNHSNLSDFSLQFFKYHDFDPRPFLRATPGLRRLCLNIRRTQNICALLPGFLRDHCPQLVALTLYEYVRPNEKSIFRDQPVDGKTAVPSSLTTPREPGLRHIVIQEQSYTGISSSILLSLIDEQTSKQLVSLNLNGPGIMNPQVMAHLNGFVFPSLRYLRLEGPYGSVTQSELCFFLQRSVPNLTHISLHDPRYHRWDNLLIDDTVLATLASSTPRLVNIRLERCHKISEAGMLDFLDRMSGQLRSITFEQCTTVMTGKVIRFLGENLDNLDELIVDERHIFLTVADIERFLDIRSSRNNSGSRSSEKKRHNKIAKLDITFDFEYGFGTCYPGTAYLDRFFKKMDLGAREWKFAERLSMDTLNDIHFRGENAYDGEVTHISYRKKPLRYAPKTAFYEHYKAIKLLQVAYTAASTHS